MWFARRSPMEYGPRPHRPIDPGPGPPPRRARRLLRPLRKPVCRRARALNAAPGGTYVSAPAVSVWSLAGLRGHACTMHHARGEGPSLARCLSQLVASCALSSARWSMAWWGRARMQTPICSRAVPRFLLLCPRPRRAAAEQGAAQAAMAWHVRQAACSAQWCVPVRCMPGQAACPSSRSGRGGSSSSSTMFSYCYYAICLSPQLPCGRGGVVHGNTGGQTDGRTRALLHAACSYSAVSVWPYLLGRDFRCVGRWGRLRDAPACLRLRFFVPACLPIASAGLPPSACSAPIVGWGVVSGSLCCLMGASTSVVLCMCYHSRLGQCVCVYLLLPPPRDKCISRVRNFYSETKGLWSRFG